MALRVNTMARPSAVPKQSLGSWITEKYILHQSQVSCPQYVGAGQ